MTIEAIILSLNRFFNVLLFTDLKKPCQIYFITSIVLFNTSGYKSNPTIPFMMVLNKCLAYIPPTQIL